MKKTLLILFLAFFAISIHAQTDLFFSEYAEGTGNNKCVEIYNPTNQDVDLSEYYVLRFSNGNSTFTSGGATQLEGTLEPYKTYVLVNGQTTSTSSSPACSPVLQALANQLDHDYPAPTYMNGNDAIALIKTPGGETPNADMSNVTSVDLIGQIGLGSLIEDETGWSYVQDSTLTYNNSGGEPVDGQIINFIVQDKAMDGNTYGPFWMSWTSNHSLIRKPTVVDGIKANPNPFNVKMEWDTVAAVLDSLGYPTYTDIWTNLGSHACVADPNYLSVDENSAMGTLSLYPNPVVSDHFAFNTSAPVESIYVFDILGKVIYQEVFTSPVKTTDVAVASMKKGVYMVKVVFVDNSSTTQKLLVR